MSCHFILLYFVVYIVFTPHNIMWLQFWTCFFHHDMTILNPFMRRHEILGWNKVNNNFKKIIYSFISSMKCNSLIHSQLYFPTWEVKFLSLGGRFIASLLFFSFFVVVVVVVVFKKNSYVHVTWPSFVFVEL